MKKVINVLLFLSLIFAIAQPAECGRQGGLGYFSFGWQSLNLNALNSVLKENGYSEFSGSIFSIGGGGQAIVDNLIIGGEGYSLSSKEELSSNLDYKTSITAGYGFFNIGYIVYEMKDLIVYPVFGIGGGGMTMRIVERSNPTFTELMINPERGSELTTGGLLFNIAVGSDYMLTVGDDSQGKACITLGARLGYIISPTSPTLKMNNIEVPGSPDINLSGPYFRINLGFGGFDPK